jgi:hypothetical protein
MGQTDKIHGPSQNAGYENADGLLKVFNDQQESQKSTS